MTATERIKQIQTILGVAPDGDFGHDSEAALELLVADADDEQNPPSSEVHQVKASSFADTADISAFKKCKAQGRTDQECFAVGDNGIGKWGDDTTADVPMCALPPEKWKPFEPHARGKKVLVKCGDKEVVCELRDTMPKEANIKNGAGIDLNPAAWKALGHTPPVMLPATWQWA